MASHFTLFNPQQFAKKAAKAVIGGIGAGLIPVGAALAWPQFEPPEHVGFPAGSMGDNFMSVIQTGDILLFNQPQFIPKPVKWAFSQLQKAANSGDYEQVGVVVWNRQQQYPYILEKTLFGTIATPFEDRIAWTGSQDVLLRTLHLFRTPEFQQKAASFIIDEMEKSGASKEGALTRGLRWSLMFKSLWGSWARDFNALKIKPNSTLLNFTSMEDISNLQYSNDPFEREQYERLVSSTKQRGSTQAGHLVPNNRVLQYSQIVSTLRGLRITEDKLSKHFHAETSRKEYERAKFQFEQSQAQANKKSTIVHPDDEDKKSNSLFNAPTPPNNLNDELQPKDLMLMLQKREFLYSEFEQQYDEYRKATVLNARFGLYRPLNNDSVPAFPSTEMVVRLYQDLNLLPRPEHPKLSPIDVEVLFPPSLPALESHERRDQHDLRKFNFANAFETLTKFAPTSLEYKPYNFRLQNPMYLSQGMFGDEQYLIQSFNKPPVEHRTGFLSTPQQSKKV